MESEREALGGVGSVLSHESLHRIFYSVKVSELGLLHSSESNTEERLNSGGIPSYTSITPQQKRSIVETHRRTSRNVRGVKVVISWCCGSEGLMSCWTLNGSHTWSKSIFFPLDQPRKGFPQGSWDRYVYHMHFKIIAISSVTWITPSMISTCGDQYHRATLKSVGIYAHWNGRDPASLSPL